MHQYCIIINPQNTHSFNVLIRNITESVQPKSHINLIIKKVFIKLLLFFQVVDDKKVVTI